MLNAAEVWVEPLPTAGLRTTTSALPKPAELGMVAVNSVVETNPEEIPAPRNNTAESDRKFRPRIRMESPGRGVLDNTDEITGTGSVTRKVPPVASPPPGAGFVTPTRRSPIA